MGGRRARLAPLAVLVALAVLAAIAVGAVLVRSSSNDDGARKSARARPTVPATGAPHEPHPAPTGGRSATEQAAPAARRRFLKGYLPHRYGRGAGGPGDAVPAPPAAPPRPA